MDEAETLLTCPYNMAHSVRKGRMQVHLTKCRRQYPNSENTTCPYNAAHVIPKQEYDIHVGLCPDRILLDEFISRTHGAMAPLPIVEVPRPPVQIPFEENWDEEVVEGSILATIAAKAKERQVFLRTSGMAPAERRAYRQCERRRHQELKSSEKMCQSTQDSNNEVKHVIPSMPPHQEEKSSSDCYKSAYASSAGSASCSRTVGTEGREKSVQTVISTEKINGFVGRGRPCIKNDIISSKIEMVKMSAFSKYADLFKKSHEVPGRSDEAANLPSPDKCFQQIKDSSLVNSNNKSPKKFPNTLSSLINEPGVLNLARNSKEPPKFILDNEGLVENLTPSRKIQKPVSAFSKWNSSGNSPGLECLLKPSDFVENDNSICSGMCNNLKIFDIETNNVNGNLTEARFDKDKKRKGESLTQVTTLVADGPDVQKIVDWWSLC